jgi:GTP-binding protein EngB required for normal cell division
MTAPTLADRFDALGRFVRVARSHVDAGPEVSDVDTAAMAAAGRLSDRAGARLRLSADLTVVALAGATGSGKSSLFNSLARMELSATGHLRPTTAAAHACVWGDRDADQLLDWLGVTHRFRRESALDAQDEAALHGLVLLDLPDLDSVAAGHRLEADRLVGVVDLVVWVLDPQKYADQTVHEEYLRHMAALRDVTVVVFNQIDLLSPADAERCIADLARLVDVDGLPGVPVIGTSARTGAGVDELRGRLEKAIAGRHAALSRLEGELDDAVDGLIPLVSKPLLGKPLVSYPLVGTEPHAFDDDPLDRATVTGFADELADAASVPALAAEARRAYAHRAAVPGWPLRSGPVAGDRGVPPADPAAVAVAARRLAELVGAGLPPPWPDEIQAAIGGTAERVPDELGETLNRLMPPLPPRRSWIALRTLWWLAVAAVVAGIAWLVWLAAFHGPRARLAGVYVPVWLIAAGTVVGLLVPLIGRPLARRRARRYGTRVFKRLRDGALTVARESVAPVRGVLRDYGAARSALQVAAGRSGSAGTE